MYGDLIGLLPGEAQACGTSPLATDSPKLLADVRELFHHLVKVPLLQYEQLGICEYLDCSVARLTGQQAPLAKIVPWEKIGAR